jgi:hypothetical protein
MITKIINILIYIFAGFGVCSLSFYLIGLVLVYIAARLENRLDEGFANYMDKRFLNKIGTSLKERTRRVSLTLFISTTIIVFLSIIKFCLSLIF